MRPEPKDRATASDPNRLTRREWLRLAAGAAAFGPAALLAAKEKKNPVSDSSRGIRGDHSLRGHAAVRGLLFGASVDPERLAVETLATGAAVDDYTRLVAEQAGLVTAGRAMCWQALQPAAGAYDFTQIDRLARFAGICRQVVHGGALCWHEGLPGWLVDGINRKNARALLAEHIRVVVGRYAGQMHSWDVVAEPLLTADGRADGLRRSTWLETIGPDYLELALKTAAVADPRARLAIVESGIALDEPAEATKRGQLLLLLRRLKARDVPVHAVGILSRLDAAGPQPGEGLSEFVRSVGELGLEVYATGLEVNTQRLTGNQTKQDAAVASVYAGYVARLAVEANVRVVMTAGLINRESPLNRIRSEENQRADGQPQRPLPFDDHMQPTAAFWALRAALDGGQAGTNH